MLLKNGQNIEQVIAFPAVSQLVSPVFKLGRENTNTFEHTKINRGFKHGQQVFDVEVERQADDLAMGRFESLRDGKGTKEVFLSMTNLRNLRRWV
jgi:hypothetical protein